MRKLSFLAAPAFVAAAALFACQRPGEATLFAADAHASPLAAAADAPQTAAPQGDKNLTPLPSLAPLVKQLRPVVVNINSRFKPRPPKMAQRLPGRGNRMRPPAQGDEGDGADEEPQDPMERFFRFFGNPDGRGGQPDTQERRGLGSGFLIGNGLVLTNNHVVEVQDERGGKFRAMDEIKVITDETAPGGSREYAAKVVGADDKADIALLRLEDPKGRTLPGATLGDSDKLEVGDYVVAIGEPFGLQATVTSGIISAKERSQFGGPYSDYLQTDASINPGNSGGPLFNLRGEVIGVNSAIISGANTIGFAIPIAVVKQILPQLQKNGRVARGFLGVQPQALTQDMVDQLGLKSTKGALIADVVKGGPAEKAGLKAGDVIVAVNGQPVADNYQLTRDVGAVQPGNSVKLDYIREGKQRALEVKVAGRPEEQSETAISKESGARDQKGSDPLGLTVEDLTPELARRARVDPGSKGAVVTDVTTDSGAGVAGIEAGDVIMEIGRQPVNSAADYNRVARGLKKGDSVLVRVRRGQGAQYLTVKIPK
ncbi:MAG: DegQ family serine endoprotease [Myxococcales bacterium]